MFSYTCRAQHLELRSVISQIADKSCVHLGVFMRLLETEDTLSYHNSEHYVMQSMFKFPIAIMVLNQVDASKLRLNQQVYLTKEDLKKNTVSALFDKYPNANVSVSIAEILTDMVTLSDNNACDVLLKLLGGPISVEKYIKGLGVENIQIRFNEQEMHANWNDQYLNWCTPSAQVELLQMIFEQKILSVASNDLLRKLMRETYVTPKRIRYLLPKGTVVEHRSGSSGTNDQGLSPATNDIATITLPNGKHLAIAILLTDSHDDDIKRDLIIAQIANAAYDEFLKSR